MKKDLFVKALFASDYWYIKCVFLMLLCLFITISTLIDRSIKWESANGIFSNAVIGERTKAGKHEDVILVTHDYMVKGTTYQIGSEYLVKPDEFPNEVLDSINLRKEPLALFFNVNKPEETTFNTQSFHRHFNAPLLNSLSLFLMFLLFAAVRLKHNFDELEEELQTS